jgi:hypothetical protein
MDDFSKLPIGDHHATVERSLVQLPLTSEVIDRPIKALRFFYAIHVNSNAATA